MNDLRYFFESMPGKIGGQILLMSAGQKKEEKQNMTTSLLVTHLQSSY